tara:strand:- start:2878 stop:3513 length:636 start_codon:yes stop_codon:yes gene_type:complete
VNYKSVNLSILSFVALGILQILWGQARQSTGVLFDPGGYRLGYGDEVQIMVFGEPEVTTAGKISRKGTIRLVYITGDVPIVGLTAKEAEAFISKQYYEHRIYRKAHVLLKITKYSAKEVMVTGKFAQTGPFVFPPEVEAMDILEVITRNGGFAEAAKTSEVKVTRVVHDKNGSNKKEVYTVDVKARMEGDVESKPFMIYPGDTLFVREKLI